MNLENDSLVRIARNGIVYTGHEIHKKRNVFVYSIISENGKRLDTDHFMYVSTIVYPVGGPALSNRETAKKRFTAVADNLEFDKDVTSARVVITPIVPQFKDNALSLSTIKNYNLDRPYGVTKVQEAQIRRQMINRMRNEFFNDNPYIRS